MTRRLTKDTRRCTKPPPDPGRPSSPRRQHRHWRGPPKSLRTNDEQTARRTHAADPDPSCASAPNRRHPNQPTAPDPPNQNPMRPRIRPRPQPTAASQCIRVHPRSSAANRPSLPNHEPRPHPPAPQHAEHRTKTPCTQSKPARRRGKTPCARTSSPKDAHKNPMRPGNQTSPTAPALTPDQSPQHAEPKPHAPRANPNPFPSAPRRARVPPCQSSSPNRSITSPT